MSHTIASSTVAPQSDLAEPEQPQGPSTEDLAPSERAPELLISQSEITVDPPDCRELGDRHAVKLLWTRRVDLIEHNGPACVNALLRGQVSLQTGAGRFCMQEGTHLFLGEQGQHMLRAEANEPFLSISVFFRPGFLKGLIAPHGPPGGDDSVIPARTGSAEITGIPGHNPDITRILQWIGEGLMSKRADHSWLERYITHLGMAFLRSHDDLIAASRLDARQASTRAELLRRARAARDYIDRNLDADLRLDRVAREAALSPFHFHRVFTGAFGETVHAYVLRRRLERAHYLLLHTRCSATEISGEVGFSSLSAFSAAFRKQYGQSPARLRKIAERQNAEGGEDASPDPAKSDPR